MSDSKTKEEISLIKRLEDEVKEELLYLNKLKVKSLLNNDYVYRLRCVGEDEIVYLSGKMDSTDYEKDQRHFLTDPVYEELKKTYSDIERKRHVIKSLTNIQQLTKQNPDEKKYLQREDLQ